MRNICLTISYEGSRYHGFQIQPELPSIQEKLQDAIRSLTRESVTVYGSGRTDAGVHARAQVVNFNTSSRIPIDRWCQALNAHLPDDIVVWAAREVSPTFHARKLAKNKTYCYCVNGNRYPDPLYRLTELHHPGLLNLREMEEAIKYLRGTHDFTSFCSIRTETISKERTIFDAWMTIEKVPGMEKVQGTGRIRMFFTGNGFLYNMVRIMAGTLIAVGEGKLKAADIPAILQAKDRTASGPTLKPHGLTLWSVEYGDEWDLPVHGL